MYIFKNAFKSITRSWMRNILIGIIVLLIAVSSCISLIIRNSANEIVENSKNSYNIEGVLGIDRQSLMQKAQQSGTNLRDFMSEIPTLTIDDIKKYGDSEYLKDYSYTLTSTLNSTTISPVTNSNNNNNNNNNNNDNFPGGGGNNGGNDSNIRRSFQGDFRIMGYSSTTAMSNFIGGTYKIKDGSIFSDTDTSNVCVISDELATANNLKVGSEITFVNPNDETQTYKFTVKGIYTDNTATDDTRMNFFSNAANQIITNFTALNTIVENSKANTDTQLTSQLSSVFNIKSAADVDLFTKELKSKGLSDYYSLTTNLSSFDDSVKPLSNLINFSTIFLILVLIIGAVVLVVLNMINIRERKYEVGVLRAIGMKKSKVLMQFISELFIVTFVAIIFGTGIGAVTSVPTANYMLKNEIANQQQQLTQINDNFGRQFGGQNVRINNRGLMGGMFGRNNPVNYIDKINAVINYKVLLQLLIIGVSLTILSSAISIILISRYTPLKILSSRS